MKLNLIKYTVKKLYDMVVRGWKLKVMHQSTRSLSKHAKYGKLGIGLGIRQGWFVIGF